MKTLYLKYTKYIFLLFLAYSFYIFSSIHTVEIAVTEILIAVVLPFLPVLLSSYFATKSDKELSGTYLNLFTLSIPAIVSIIEAHLIMTKSLTADGTGFGFIASFAMGTVIFFVLYGVTLISTLFVNKRNVPLEQGL